MSENNNLMTNADIIRSLEACAADDCSNCKIEMTDNCFERLKIIAALRMNAMVAGQDVINKFEEAYDKLNRDSEMPKWKPIEKEAGGIHFKAWQCSECGCELAFRVEWCPKCLSDMDNLIKEEHKMEINLSDHRKIAEANKICSSGSCDGCIYVDDDDCGNIIRNDSYKALTDLIGIVENSLCDDVAGEPEKESDAVKHPDHYNQGSIEVWDAIDDWGLNFCLGNVVKYVARAGHKGDKLEDLKKARNYLDREIRKLEEE